MPLRINPRPAQEAPFCPPHLGESWRINTHLGPDMPLLTPHPQATTTPCPFQPLSLL